jgi:acyl-CoA synthetase (AMP-forming)/AMP-acid ligase II
MANSLLLWGHAAGTMRRRAHPKRQPGVNLKNNGDKPMLGLMQSQQLLISSLIDFADRHHGEAEVVSRRVEGDIHRSNYKQVAARSRQVAHALDAWDLGFGDRVATLAWNGYRHLELYFGLPPARP